MSFSLNKKDYGLADVHEDEAAKRKRKFDEIEKYTPMYQFEYERQQMILPSTHDQKKLRKIIDRTNLSGNEIILDHMIQPTPKSKAVANHISEIGVRDCSAYEQVAGFYKKNMGSSGMSLQLWAGIVIAILALMGWMFGGSFNLKSDVIMMIVFAALIVGTFVWYALRSLKILRIIKSGDFEVYRCRVFQKIRTVHIRTSKGVDTVIKEYFVDCHETIFRVSQDEYDRIFDEALVVVIRPDDPIEIKAFPIILI